MGNLYHTNNNDKKVEPESYYGLKWKLILLVTKEDIL